MSQTEKDFLRSLIQLLQERLNVLESKIPSQNTPRSLRNDVEFLQKVQSLKWNPGNREGNEFVKRVDCPDDVKDYMQKHGKNTSSGFVLYMEGFKIFLTNGGILGRDLING